MKKQKGLLVCTIICIIITILSLSLNVVLLTSNHNNDTKTNTEEGMENAILYSLADTTSIDLSTFNKKTITPTNSQSTYDMYSLKTNIFNIGDETLSIKKEKDKISVARIIIQLNNTKTLEEARETIVKKLKEVNHIADVVQITKTVNKQSIKIENLSNENIADAERMNIALKTNENVQENVSVINISIRPEEINGQLTYEVVVSYLYEKPTASAQQKAPVDSTPEETHEHNH